MLVIISGDNRGPLATGPLFAVLPVAGIIFAGRGRVLVCCGQCNTIQHKYSNVNTHSHTASASRHRADVTETERSPIVLSELLHQLTFAYLTCMYLQFFPLSPYLKSIVNLATLSSL